MDITPIMDERMAKIETKVDYMASDIKEIKDMIKNFDGKYSGKWVEKAFMGVSLIIGTIIIGYLFRGLK